MAKLSAIDANVLILDEPTNHLDLWARQALEKAVRDFEGTVLFISHDRYFVDRVADHLLIIQPDARFKTLEGNYSTFRMMVSQGLMADPFLTDALANRNAAGGAGKSMTSTLKTSATSSKKTEASSKKAEQDAWKAAAKQKEADRQSQQKAVSQSSTSRDLPSQSGKKRKEPLRQEEHWKNSQGKAEQPDKKPKRERKFPFRKVADIEEEIFARETQIMTLNDDLLRPEIARDGEKVRTIHLEIKEEQNKIALLYEHWEEAAERNW